MTFPSTYHHQSVMLSEVIAYLQPHPGKIYVDATLGGGGHTEAILQASSPDGVVLGIDQDPAALAATQKRLLPYGNRFRSFHGQFADIKKILTDQGYSSVDGIIADLGVSSPQIDQAERGFSFQQAGPLDMRMNPHQEETAWTLLKKLSVEDLTFLLQTYGEERFAKRIAIAINQAFNQVPSSESIEIKPLNTYQLAQLIAKTIPFHEKGKHPATRTFLALRMAVNNELGQLEQFLQQAPHCLSAEGRLVVLTFHSLEDRLVKQAFRQLKINGSFELLTTKPISPSMQEVEQNPRSRSVHLRSILRLPFPKSTISNKNNQNSHSLWEGAV